MEIVNRLFFPLLSKYESNLWTKYSSSKGMDDFSISFPFGDSEKKNTNKYILQDACIYLNQNFV